jgi:hypothetical protein
VDLRRRERSIHGDASAEGVEITEAVALIEFSEDDFPVLKQ